MKNWRTLKCRIPDCEKRVSVKVHELCGMHYRRWQRYGDTGHVQRITGDDVRRFWSYVEKGKPDECWVWGGNTDKQGYGRFQLGRRSMGAHAYSLEISSDKVRPDDLNALHSCDNPPCVNPNHLRWGTHQDNSNDAIDRGRVPRGEEAPLVKLTEADVIDIRNLYAIGGQSEELALRYGVSVGNVRSIARGETWTHVSGPRTRRHAQITPEIESEIVRRRASGETAVSLAKEFGCNRTTIFDVMNRQRKKETA